MYSDLNWSRSSNGMSTIDEEMDNGGNSVSVKNNSLDVLSHKLLRNNSTRHITFNTGDPISANSTLISDTGGVSTFDDNNIRISAVYNNAGDILKEQ